MVPGCTTKWLRIYRLPTVFPTVKTRQRSNWKRDRGEAAFHRPVSKRCVLTALNYMNRLTACNHFMSVPNDVL